MSTGGSQRSYVGINKAPQVITEQKIHLWRPVKIHPVANYQWSLHNLLPTVIPQQSNTEISELPREMFKGIICYH